MNSPDISIIIPVYNAEKYLTQCLDSILFQTFEQWEALLIDDGSVDSSSAICNDFALIDGRFRIIRQENAGASAARNTGLDNARGKWIAFVDSDDWIVPEYVELMLQTASSQQADAVFCNCFVVRDHYSTPQFVYKDIKQLSSDELLKRFLTVSNVRSELWGKIFKSELLTSLRLNNHIRIGEDMLYLIALYYANSLKTSILTEPLYYYRQLDTSLMRTGNLVEDIKQTLLTYEHFVHENPDLAEKYPVENATFIVRLLTYLTKQDVMRQFKDTYAMRLLKENLEKAKINLEPNELRFIRLLLIHPLAAKIGFEINKLKNRFK